MIAYLLRIIEKESIHLVYNLLCTFSAIRIEVCMQAPYAPFYSNSHAVIIGINDYSLGDISPLGYARNDAEVFAGVLIEGFDFPEDNVHVLVDQQATRENIMKAYWALTQTGTAPDDRLIFFYAGHGGKLSGVHGDRGFLIPCDAMSDDPSSYISWTELTDTARNHFHAKHTLFIADACFSGHAIKRYTPGAKRFVKDMLSRRALQVIASGKSDEPVADLGGPRPNHSPFMGHLLDALDGNAANEDGLLTANYVMNYVYRHVGTGYGLEQTPHYGMLDGEGDFIFRESPGEGEQDEEAQPREYQPNIYTYPIDIGPEVEEASQSGVDLIKQYISSPTDKIKLFDHMVSLFRSYEEKIATHNFTMDESELSAGLPRLEIYEDAVQELRDAATCIAHWGTSEHFNFLQRIIGRMASGHGSSGRVHLLALQYYPLYQVFMAASIAAIAAGNYEALRHIFLAKGRSENRRDNSYLQVTLADELLQLTRVDFFKQLPGHENNYVPRSEYIFKRLQPHMDDILFLGDEYEEFFDQFEILHALHYRYLVGDQSLGWFPLGRFAWKARGFSSQRSHPLKTLTALAEQELENFAPIRAGLFGGNVKELLKLAAELAEVTKRQGW